jgi:hypothetical protein
LVHNQTNRFLLSERKPEQKRDFLKKIGSNFEVAEKSLTVELKNRGFTWLISIPKFLSSLRVSAKIR